MIPFFVALLNTGDKIQNGWIAGHKTAKNAEWSTK
jgi:hypothetical protein